MYPVVVIVESALKEGKWERSKIMRNEVMQKIGDRIVSDDGLYEGSVVQIYDEDVFGRTVTFIVVRWDEDPEFGINIGFDDPHCEPIDSSYFIWGDKQHAWIVKE